MKILDSTTLIAIFKEIACPELIDKILLLNHQLLIPSQNVDLEILDPVTQSTTKKLVVEKKLKTTDINTKSEVIEFQKKYQSLGFGECNVILAYLKLVRSKKKAYCVLDDGSARAKAKSLGIKFTGLLGLLRLLKKKEIVTDSEIKQILAGLEQSNFRIPGDVVI